MFPYIMIRSLDDIKKEESKKKNDSNDFYVGGEKSGLAVSTPDVQSIVDRAKQNPVQRDEREASNEPKIRVSLYSNGFTVNDGPFRDYNLPESKTFMEQTNQGQVPDELLRMTKGKPANFILDDRRSEEYELPPAPKYTAFSGEGQSLSQNSSTATEPINLSTGQPAVDPASPTCNLQIRFHNGQKKNITMNCGSKVGVLYEYVMVAAPVEGSFTLMSGFPPRPLEDPNLSIEEAGLSGAAVIQRLT